MFRIDGGFSLAVASDGGGHVMHRQVACPLLQVLHHCHLLKGEVPEDDPQSDLESPCLRHGSLNFSAQPLFGENGAFFLVAGSFARTWLNELKGRNIRVNVLSPGPIATPMQDQVLTDEAKRMFESVIPRGKMGRPEEIATAAVFLASDDSSFVNGVELSVDGGLSAI